LNNQEQDLKHLDNKFKKILVLSIIAFVFSCLITSLSLFITTATLGLWITILFLVMMIVWILGIVYSRRFIGERKGSIGRRLLFAPIVYPFILFALFIINTVLVLTNQ